MSGLHGASASVSLSEILSTLHDISFFLWCVWLGMGGCTPRLQIPTTTRLDQQQHMGLVPWWVTAHKASVESHVVPRAHNDKPWSNLPCFFCQQASLYRGGYNRFTPYWATCLGQGCGEGRSPSAILGLSDLLTLQDRYGDPRKWFHLLSPPRVWRDCCKYRGTHSLPLLLINTT